MLCLDRLRKVNKRTYIKNYWKPEEGELGPERKGHQKRKKKEPRSQQDDQKDECPKKNFPPVDVCQPREKKVQKKGETK